VENLNVQAIKDLENVYMIKLAALNISKQSYMGNRPEILKRLKIVEKYNNDSGFEWFKDGPPVQSHYHYIMKNNK